MGSHQQNEKITYEIEQTIYTNMESCRIPETNVVHVNYISMKKLKNRKVNVDRCEYIF